MSRTYYSKADSGYMKSLHQDLAEKHSNQFENCEKNLETTIASMKWWYMQIPKGSHPVDLNPKSMARYYICSCYIHELIRYLHFLDKFEYACENYDIDEIVKVEFLIPK